MSILHASVHLAPTVRWAFILYSAGVFCTTSDWKMKPVCLEFPTRALVENPTGCFF